MTGDWRDSLKEKFDELAELAKSGTVATMAGDPIKAAPADQRPTDLDEGPPLNLQGSRLIFSPQLVRPVCDAIRKSLEGGSVEFYDGQQPANPIQVPGDATLVASLPIIGFYEWCGSLWVCVPLAANDSSPAGWLRMVGADGAGLVLGAYAYYVDAGQLRLRIWW